MNRIIITLLILLVCGCTDGYESHSAEKEMASAMELWQQGKKTEALLKLKPLAKHGNSTAQSLIGSYYLEGGNKEEGRLWLTKAAESGNPYAQHNLAVSYLGYDGGKYNSQGMKWLKQAAEQGYKPAESQLAHGYSKGWWGLTQNDEKALYWSERANSQ